MTAYYYACSRMFCGMQGYCKEKWILDKHVEEIRHSKTCHGYKGDGKTHNIFVTECQDQPNGLMGCENFKRVNND